MGDKAMSEKKKHLFVGILLSMLLLNIAFSLINLFSETDFTFYFFVADIICFAVSIAVGIYVLRIKGNVRFLYAGITIGVLGSVILLLS
jgi:hypothetical protein